MHHQVLLQELAKGEKRHRKSALVLQMRKNGNGKGLHPQDLGQDQDLDPGVDQVRDVEVPHVVDVGHGVEVVVKFDHHEKIAEVKVDLHEKIGKVLLRDDGDRDHQNRGDRDHQNREDRDHQDRENRDHQDEDQDRRDKDHGAKKDVIEEDLHHLEPHRQVIQCLRLEKPTDWEKY